MNKMEKIIEMAKNNNGYVTTKEVKEAKINSAELTKLVRKGKLDRISRGYYCITNSFIDDYYKYQLKSKNCIFSHATALYFYDLSDRVPLYFDMTVPVGYHGSLSESESLLLHYVKKENLELGLTYIESPFGMKLRVYDMERTICDIIKNKNHMDIEIFTKALQRYARLKNKNLHRLMKYAKQLKVDKKVREYMEVLL